MKIPMARPALIMGILICLGRCFAGTASGAAAIDEYLQPYVSGGNFAGRVLVARNGKIEFEKAYGWSDRERGVKNTAAAQFHVASMSMQFTAAAVMRLVDMGAITLDDRVSEFAPGINGADRISIRHLLTQRSGLPDINSLPEYDDILKDHQTPASLVAKIEGKPPLFEPGTKFLHEEHSAYNLLALIVEKKSGLTFAAAMERLLFRPMGLSASGVDDDSSKPSSHLAEGYEPVGTDGLRLANRIHWSAKTGNASAYTTARDEAAWLDALFHGHLLSSRSREDITDSSMRVGYGWFKGEDKRFGETAYYMNGRAPGFSSFVLYLPKAGVTVVALSNIYSSATTTIGYDIAAISLGLPYESFRVAKPAPTVAELNACAGSFRFGPDFYQPNATLTTTVEGGELHVRWPSSYITVLIPQGRDHFVDRSYWVPVGIVRDARGRPVSLAYDRFSGQATAGSTP
jgi:CubicO group peptidase (beta-lactamase class C family)